MSSSKVLPLRRKTHVVWAVVAAAAVVLLVVAFAKRREIVALFSEPQHAPIRPDDERAPPRELPGNDDKRPKEPRSVDTIEREPPSLPPKPARP